MMWAFWPGVCIGLMFGAFSIIVLVYWLDSEPDD